MNTRRWAYGVSIALVALFFLGACSQKAAPPKLSFDREQVSLGTVPRDHWGVVTFLAVNRGQGPLNLGPFVISAQQGTALATPPQGTLVVKPGESGVVPVVFTGHQVAGPHRLSLMVPSNDPVKPTSTLTIQFNVAEQPTPPPERPGPRLRVDKEMVDSGSVASDHPLYERFTLRNDGNAPLVLPGPPLVKVLDGCWPPQAVVGATTIQPGQSTLLELPMPMGMHSGMTGLHTFAIEVTSNDPVEPVKTLIWRFKVL